MGEWRVGTRAWARDYARTRASTLEVTTSTNNNPCIPASYRVALPGKIFPLRMTKPILSCCDVINFAKGKGEPHFSHLLWRDFLPPFSSPIPKFMTSQQDNMGFVVINILNTTKPKLCQKWSTWRHKIEELSISFFRGFLSYFSSYLPHFYDVTCWFFERLSSRTIFFENIFFLTISM